MTENRALFPINQQLKFMDPKTLTIVCRFMESIQEILKLMMRILMVLNMTVNGLRAVYEFYEPDIA